MDGDGRSRLGSRRGRRRLLARRVRPRKRPPHVACGQRDADARVAEPALRKRMLHGLRKRLDLQRVEEPQLARARRQALQVRLEAEHGALARKHGLEEADSMLKSSVEEADSRLRMLDEPAIDPRGHGAAPAGVTGSSRATPTTSGRASRIAIESATPSPDPQRISTDWIHGIVPSAIKGPATR